MTQQKYVVAKRSQTNKINEWYNHCKKEKIPYVVVELRTKYADVRFDFISLPIEYEKYIEKNLEQINEMAIQIFNKYANKKSNYSIGGLLVNFENIPIQYVEDAANDLFDLINSSIPSV